jgi:hypothetical protein
MIILLSYTNKEIATREVCPGDFPPIKDVIQGHVVCSMSSICDALRKLSKLVHTTLRR